MKKKIYTVRLIIRDIIIFSLFLTDTYYFILIYERATSFIDFFNFCLDIPFYLFNYYLLNLETSNSTTFCVFQE